MRSLVIPRRKLPCQLAPEILESWLNLSARHERWQRAAGEAQVCCSRFASWGSPARARSPPLRFRLARDGVVRPDHDPHRLRQSCHCQLQVEIRVIRSEPIRHRLCRRDQPPTWNTPSLAAQWQGTYSSSLGLASYTGANVQGVIVNVCEAGNHFPLPQPTLDHLHQRRRPTSNWPREPTSSAWPRKMARSTT